MPLKPVRVPFFFQMSNKLFERTWLKTNSTPIVRANYTIIIGSLHTSELS